MRAYPNMLAALAGLGFTAALSGCGTQPSRIGGYQPEVQTVTVELAFAPGSARLDRADLRRLYSVVPPPTTDMHADLVTGADWAQARAVAVSRAIGMKVGAFTAPWPSDLGSRAGRLTVTKQIIVARACDGPPVHLQNQLWPLTPDSGIALRPTGCAVDRDMAAMIDRPDDLFAGRKLAPPGVQPFVEAARRYETRNRFKPPYGQGFPSTGLISQSALQPTTDGGTALDATSTSPAAAPSP
jgi:hypothetical protein